MNHRFESFTVSIARISRAITRIEKCEEDKATISRSLEYLEKEEYIIRRGKRYNSIIELSEKGRKTAEEIAARIHPVLNEVISIFPMNREPYCMNHCLK